MNPLSAVFGMAVHARNALYDSRAIRPGALRAPVVSIGNISVGGAGKTPFTILLGSLLQQRGLNIDILSRGYGRVTRGAMRVNPAGEARRFGDEPLLMARAVGVPVYVGERRVDAGRLAESECTPDLHLLDDAFQHRQLARDFDIVLVSEQDVRDSLIPAGRLREPVSSLARADVVVIAHDVDAEPVRRWCKHVWRIRRDVDVNYPARAAVAFCGIAKPKAFFAQLRRRGIPLAAEVSFRDHHSYTPNDIAELQRIALEHRADGFVTTEKDAINLGTLSEGLRALTTAKVSMELLDSDAALDHLLATVRQRRTNWPH